MEQNITSSQELLLYMPFWRRFMLRRMIDLNNQWNRKDLVELPRSCVIHLIDDNFLMNKPIVFVPEDDNWLLGMMPNLKFINHVTQPVEGRIPFKESFLLPQKGVIPTLLNYRKRTMRWMRPWKDTSKMPPVLKSQAVVSYLSLYRARIFGQLKATRRFNYILTSVLNNICKMPAGIKHFIPIPVGNTEYNRGEFVMSFKGYTKPAIRHPNDPWYQFCMHLYGYMHTGTESLFSKLPTNIQENLHFILYSKHHLICFTLKTLLDFNNGKRDTILIRFIKQLNNLAQDGQALSFTDFGAVAPAADDESDVDSSGIKEEDLNDETLVSETPVKVTPKLNEVPMDNRLKLSAQVTEDEVVARPAVNTKLDEQKAVAYKFSRMSMVGLYSKIADRYKRFLTDHRLFEAIKGEQFSRRDLFKRVGDLLSSYYNSTKPHEVTGVEIKEDNTPVNDAIPILTGKGLHAAAKNAVSTKDITDGDKDIVVTNSNPNAEIIKAESINDIITDIPVVDEIKPELVTIQPKLVNNGKTVTNAPAYTKSPAIEKIKEFNSSTTDDLDVKATEAIASREDLTNAQATRAYNLSQMYKTIKVDNKTIKEILDSTPDDKVSSNELDFLKGQVPDESMLKSSVANFDTEYIDKFFKRDLIMEMASFNRVGMFLKDFKMTDISDSMNNMYEVVAKYEDLNHKQHTVRFSVPKVDRRGYCYINGGLKVLKKQRITNPICKVSPVRVTLSSDYNKYLVERATTVAHSFINYIDKIVENSEHKIAVIFGTAKLPTQPFPYEFTAIARKYTAFRATDPDDPKNPWFFSFNNGDATREYFLNCGFTKKEFDEAIDTEDDVKGYLVGMYRGHDLTYVYMKMDGSIAIVNGETGTTNDGSTFIDLLCEICNLDISHLSEWTEFKLLSKSVPTIFALCYRYGLSYMLNYTKCKYAIYDKRARYPRRQSDVIIKFKDKVLVIPRAPLTYSLLFAGLNNYDLSKVEIEEMDSKDIYFDLLQAKKMSVHNLKGIDNFFDLFVDPITRDVLFRMGEPTEARDLLIRATALLTTEDHPPVSANTNYRFRSYERICTAVYKILANTYSVYRYRGIGASNTFSIKDFEITNMVISDQLMEPVDQLNPVNDIKYREEYGHGGAGGRQSTDTFMVEDRQWPEDGVGVIGESSVDNGKTGYAGNMSSNPTIDNIRGLTISKKIEDVEPSEAYTCTTLLGPCVTQDDSKRMEPPVNTGTFDDFSSKRQPPY